MPGIPRAAPGTQEQRSIETFRHVQGCVVAGILTKSAQNIDDIVLPCTRRLFS